MDLSRNIIKRYVQVASPEKITSNSETVYGTVVNEGETLYVKIDGSNILTPVSSTIDIKANDRVLVLVKNHEATVIGSPSSPTARLEELTKLGGKVTKLDTVVASKVGADELVAIQGSIDNLQASDVNIAHRLTVNEGNINNLTTENTNIKGQLNAYKADIENLSADHADFKKATAKDFKAVNASIDNLNTKNATIEGTLNAHNASINNLTTTVFDAEDSGRELGHTTITIPYIQKYDNRYTMRIGNVLKYYHGTNLLDTEELSLNESNNTLTNKHTFYNGVITYKETFGSLTLKVDNEYNEFNFLVGSSDNDFATVRALNLTPSQNLSALIM